MKSGRRLACAAAARSSKLAAAAWMEEASVPPPFDDFSFSLMRDDVTTVSSTRGYVGISAVRRLLLRLLRPRARITAVVMETDVYGRWRKDETGAAPALIKILSSRHNISINSKGGGWRPSVLLFPLLAPVPPPPHVTSRSDRTFGYRVRRQSVCLKRLS